MFISIILPKLPDEFEQLLLYSIELYIGITTLRSLAIYICVLFMSLMQSGNRGQFLNITFIVALFVAMVAAEVSATVITSFKGYKHHCTCICSNLALKS